MKQHRVCGFTLLECLIALLVIALVLGGAMFLSSSYADQRLAMQDRFAAHTVAWNRLVSQYQLVQGWTPPNTGPSSSSGVERQFGREWRWQLEATSTFADNFYRYEVRVASADSGENEFSALLVAFFVAPP